MFRINFSLFCLLAFSLFFSTSPVMAEFDHQYPKYTQLLKSYVKKKGAQTLFHYQALKKNPKELDQILSRFSALTKKEFEKFTQEEKLAFLINTYNIFTIKLIVENYPLKSIKDIGSIFSGPWSKEVVTVFGEKYTLDNIEHDMIRKDFKEPRIHFAVNCASLGCPSLLNKPFYPVTLNEQLESAAKGFLNNKEKNSFEPKKKTLYLSKIFKWYGDDWKKMTGTPLLNHIEKYLPEIKGQKIEIEYLDYDWSLNEYKEK